jgi:DNA-binding transcriptional LysR family regulator
VLEDLSAGRLVALCLPEAPQIHYQLHALWRKDSRPGPATTWMLDALIERC